MKQELASGKFWYEGINKSLLYCPILTEPADYWDSFGPLTISTNHPNGAFEFVLSDGFAHSDGRSVLQVDEPQNENLYIGFLVPDNRKEESYGCDSLLFFGCALFFSPQVLLVVLLLCAILLVLRKARSGKSE